jgi:cytochrome P450
MLLSDDFQERAGLTAPPVAPPYPVRKGPTGGALGAIRTFRRNTLGVFSETDFGRPLHRAQMLRRRVLICNTPATVREAFTDQHEIFQRKTPQMRHALSPLLGDGLFVSDGALWRERRDVVAPIVHARRMGAFAPVMAETAQEWRAHWSALCAARGADAPIDALAEMGELTAEIIARAVFGRRLGREFTGAIVSGFADYQRRIDQIDLLSLLGLPDWTPRWRGPGVRRALRRGQRGIDDVLDRFEADRRAGSADETAVIGRLFDARDAEGRPWTRTAIRNEAIVIFMAGHETTANTLAWAWSLLALCPRSRARLDAELDRVLGDRPPTLDDVPRLTVTRAILEETLRLYPPVPYLGREAIGEGVVAGEKVERGTLLLVVPWLLHRNPKVWSWPHAFLPERFEPELAPRPSRHAYVPFATGPRVCPGLTFGLTEAVLCLATLAQGFTLTLDQAEPVLPRCRLTLRPGDSLPMRLRPRAF